MVNGEIESFLACGIYRFVANGSRVAFLDPVRILNRSYSRFRISPTAYYSRSFEASTPVEKRDVDEVSPAPRKRNSRKRKRQPRDLNAREKDAEKRHQEARPLLLNAHKTFCEAKELLALLPELVKCEASSLTKRAAEQNFIELGSLWQAPLYEISLYFSKDDPEGCGLCEHERSVTHQLFNNLICNEGNEDVVAEVQTNCYILPHRSCFYMSDLRQVRTLVPAFSKEGFNLIVIDPPWENGSAYQKATYPTLPSRQFMYLPVKELAHKEGALVALWITNREKLRTFVEKELFPAWGVRDFVLFYWLKVKSDGCLISELDLFHHRPYECLLLGYTNLGNDDTKHMPFNYLRSNQVIVSIPGDYSRKPPLGKLLMDHIPGPKPARCIELFARELVAGWTSWGNEPLHFQDSIYFVEKHVKDNVI